jgi:hypothetical protein
MGQRCLLEDALGTVVPSSTAVRVLAAVAAAAVSLLIGFAAQCAHDTQSMTTVRSALLVDHADEGVSVADVLLDQAQRTGSNFYRIRVDPTGRTPTRMLVPLIGDPGLHDRVFPGGEYARFDTSTTTELRPFDGHQRGTYLSSLQPRALQDVATTLRSAGVDARVEALGWGSLVVWMALYTPTVAAGAVTIVSAGLLGFVRAVVRAREHAVARTLGVRVPFARDVVTSAAMVAAAFVVTGVVAAVALRWYNGGHQLPSYLAVSAVVLLTVVMSFVAGSVVAGLLPRGARFRAAYSGWRPWSRGRVALPTAQVAIVVLVVFLAAQAAAAWTLLAAVRDSRPDWSACAACTTTIFNGFDGPEALDDAVAPFAAAVRTLEPSGGVVLSWVPGADRGDHYDPGEPTSNVIVANPAFIAQSEGRLPDPLDGAHGAGEWGLLVPDDQADRRDSIAAAWLDVFRDPIGHVADAATPKPPQIATYPAGLVFNQGQTDFRDELYSDAPVIVVVPASAGLLDDDTYFAAGSAGDLLFTGDVAATRRALDAAGVERSVYALDTFADQIERGEASARARVPIAMSGGVAGLLAMVGLLAVRTRVYIAADRDRLRFDVTHGRSPVRAHLPMLLRTVTLLGCSACVTAAAVGTGVAGADLPPGTLGTVFGCVSAAVILTNAVIVSRRSTTRGLCSDAW